MLTIEKRKQIILFVVVLSAFFTVFLVDPIAQDQRYHHFADSRAFIGIPNAWNVLSSCSFIAVGVYAIFRLVRISRKKLDGIYRLTAVTFFIGMILTGIASGIYHLSPSNATLLWDRLAMAISFMALFSFVLAIHVNEKAALQLFLPLLILGISSVVYWGYTELLGLGDLRFYGLLQFLPMILMPFIVLMFKSTNYRVAYLWMLMGAYLIAKLAECFDAQLFQLIGLGGHALKHLFAALSGVALLYAVDSMREAKEH